LLPRLVLPLVGFVPTRSFVTTFDLRFVRCSVWFAFCFYHVTRYRCVTLRCVTVRVYVLRLFTRLRFDLHFTTFTERSWLVYHPAQFAVLILVTLRFWIALCTVPRVLVIYALPHTLLLPRLRCSVIPLVYVCGCCTRFTRRTRLVHWFRSPPQLHTLRLLVRLLGLHTFTVAYWRRLRCYVWITFTLLVATTFHVYRYLAVRTDRWIVLVGPAVIIATPHTPPVYTRRRSAQFHTTHTLPRPHTRHTHLHHHVHTRFALFTTHAVTVVTLDTTRA